MALYWTFLLGLAAFARAGGQYLNAPGAVWGSPYQTLPGSTQEYYNGRSWYPQYGILSYGGIGSGNTGANYPISHYLSPTISSSGQLAANSGPLRQWRGTNGVRKPSIIQKISSALKSGAQNTFGAISNLLPKPFQRPVALPGSPQGYNNGMPWYPQYGSYTPANTNYGGLTPGYGNSGSNYGSLGSNYGGLGTNYGALGSGYTRPSLPFGYYSPPDNYAPVQRAASVSSTEKTNPQRHILQQPKEGKKPSIFRKITNSFRSGAQKSLGAITKILRNKLSARRAAGGSEHGANEGATAQKKPNKLLSLGRKLVSGVLNKWIHHKPTAVHRALLSAEETQDGASLDP